jgi:hypothetical protein
MHSTRRIGARDSVLPDRLEHLAERAERARAVPWRERTTVLIVITG